MILLQVNKGDINTRIDKFISRQYNNLSFSNLQKFLRNGDIKVNKKKTLSNYRIKEKDTIEITDFANKIFSNSKETQKESGVSKNKVSFFIQNNILYKDENILGIFKPRGLASQGGSDIVESLEDYLPHLRFDLKCNPILVHRLDKDTQGVMILARNKTSALTLNESFKTKNKIKKIYLAAIVGKPKTEKGEIKLPLLKKNINGVEKVYVDRTYGKEAITLYELLGYSKEHDISLMKVQILTGRTHQIRAHMNEINCPILGDYKYGGHRSRIDGLTRDMQLYSYSLDLQNIFDKNIHIETKIPKIITELFGKEII